MTDETGWTWFIPLHDGTTSVGVVSNQEKSNARKAKLREEAGDSSLSNFYQKEILQTPKIVKLLEGAELVKKPDIPLIQSASDYSYQANCYAGLGYRIIGDAGGMFSWTARDQRPS